MTTRKSSTSSTLAKQAIELSIAAPQVVAHRVSRMLAAGPKMSARDRNEFMRMGTEKVLAFYQSWGAMALQACQFQADLLSSMWLPFPTTPTTARNAAKTLNRAFARNTEAFAKVLNAGLRPVHSKAVSNSKRLPRKRR